MREREGVEEALVLALIRRERGRLPRVGGRKLLGMIRGDLVSAGVAIVRDRFFGLLGRPSPRCAPADRFDPRPRGGGDYAAGAFLRAADIVSIHAPAGGATACS